MAHVAGIEAARIVNGANSMKASPRKPISSSRSHAWRFKWRNAQRRAKCGQLRIRMCSSEERRRYFPRAGAKRRSRAMKRRAREEKKRLAGHGPEISSPASSAAAVAEHRGVKCGRARRL